MRADTLGVVLAGGLARRMGGGDKPLRMLAGRPMLAHVIERLAPQVAAVAINANGDPARFAGFGLPVVPDGMADYPGPLAGVLAITAAEIFVLAKSFAEAIENADLKAWEGVESAGGSCLHACRFAVLPQVLPNILSYLLLRFEVNIRSASVIGFVGAGGVGEELYKVISFNYYEEISAIVLLIILTVAMVDLLSERLRHAAIGRLEAAR